MINKFRGDYSWLSNFAEVQIPLRKIIYPSVENAYMSEKNDSSEWKEYCRTKSPAEVKKESRGVVLRSDWDQVKLKVMEYCLWQKFNQEPFKSKLKATGNQNIQEGNTWGDTFWGVNLNVNPNYGENWLGRLIMDIRSRI